ncbi:hypothetical protein [Streptomyces sp. NBC_01601]|uniref:hypothetical protein n=1 Tax=Streptomyces sp. NBC_01601 TaxID=2975892 RepID=UPI002E2A286A|nr:hypothetical protein [Streptomyces sp. NBC_01601]
MSNEMPPVGGDELPEVDEVLAAALTAQGEPGVRALGLLQDARQILAGDFLQRPAEVAESCLRGVADALLSLPGAPVAVGLKSAAAGLLDAVDAFPGPPAEDVAGQDPAPAAEPSDPVGLDTTAREGTAGPDDTAPRSAPAAADVRPAVAPLERAGAAGTCGAGLQWATVREAAEVLRGQLVRPGGFHRARAAGIAERLTGIALGSAQERALEVWGEVYGQTSGTLHGGAADPARAAAVYGQVLAAARELLVPLPGRATRVLELAALAGPGEEEAREMAGWADPRAEAYFFRSGPAAAWLDVLEEHAPHLLLADEASGAWPAAPFLEHLAQAAADTARPWLAAHAGQLAAAGPGALDALWRLALAGALTPAGVRLLLPHVTARSRPGEPAGQAGWSRRLAARWARTLPMAERDGDWLRVAEELLKDAVDAEHAGHLALQAVAERAHAAEQRAAAGAEAAGTAWEEALADLELQEAARQETAARLPGHEVAGLLRELVRTVHPAGGGPFRWARAVRQALAGLLRRDVEESAEAARHVVFDVDLDEVSLRDASAFLGPLLARAVLDLAATDAAAGLTLTERIRAWPRIAAADAHLHDRLLASHLAAHSPSGTAGADAVGEWWDQAIDVTVRLLAGRPPAEGARLAALVLDTCPPARAGALEQRARAALGPAPSAAEVDQVLPAGAGQADGRLEPLASWLRVWDWSPLLPAPLLVGFDPLLAAVRRLKPAGPADPRSVPDLLPVKHTVTLDEEDLAQLAAAAGPFAAAAELAAAEDAGDDGYAIVLHHLVDADPAAWTADVPRALAALARPELGAFYLAAAATAARRPGAFPGGPVPAALAALTLRRALPAGQGPSAAVLFADQALFDLLSVVWRTGADLAGDLPAVLDHLRGLVAPLTRPVEGSDVAADAGADAGGEDERPPALLGSDPAVRALGCLLEYAAARARAGGAMPGDVLDLAAGALTARTGDDAVATAIGVHLPALHRHAPAFMAAHPELYVLVPGRPSPAAAWLRWGGPDPVLLAALDRGRLLAALRAQLPGADGHVAHALLTGHHDLLGEPATAWAELAAGPDGATAASRLLTALAVRCPRRQDPDDAGMPPAARAALDAATRWWTAALDASLPPGALAGAGAFADVALPDEVWLPLARASAEHTPAQEDADRVAERAAAHPASADAIVLAAHLLTRPAPAAWYDFEVRRHARALLQAAARTGHEHPDAVEELRRALVNAGEVDAAHA